MRLEGESLERLHDLVMYPDAGQDGDGALIVRFLERVQADTWLTDFHTVRDLAAPRHGSRQYVVTLRAGLRLLVVCEYEDEPNVMSVVPLGRE